MSTQAAIGTGNWSAAATFGTVDATSLLDSEAANTALTTSFVASSTFTPGALTIFGIMVKLASRAASPSGTMSVCIGQGGSAVAGTTVTVNVSDLPTCSTANNEGGWAFFAFATPVLLSAATAYSVMAKTSVSSQCNLYSSATSNWSRLLVQSNVGASPASGDTVIVAGQLTGAGTSTAITVTMDNADAGAKTFAGVAVCNKGTLAYGTAASTNYYLSCSGNGGTLQGVVVYSGGTLNLGTSGTNMPSTSSAVLEFACTSDGQYGLQYRNGSTGNGYGAVVTTVQTYLNADSHNGDTSITVASTSGWQAGDVLAIASTTRTASDCEAVTISSVTDSTHAAVSALAAPNTNITSGMSGNQGNINHSGTTPTQAEVIHLTRNVKIRSSSSTLHTYVSIAATAAVTWQYVEAYYAGTAAGTGALACANASASIQFCAIHDTRGPALSSTGSVAGIANCVFWNINTASYLGGFVVCNNNVSVVLSNCVFIKGNAGSGNVGLNSSAGLSLTGCTVVGVSGSGNFYSCGTGSGGFPGRNISLTNCVFHSGAGGAVFTDNQGALAATGCTFYRLGQSAVQDASSLTCVSVTLVSCVFFGNASHFTEQSNGFAGLKIIRSCTFNSDFFTSSVSMQFGSGVAWVINCTSGATKGMTSADIVVVGSIMAQVTTWNCILASTTQVSGIASALAGSFVRAWDLGQTIGNHKTWMPNGTVVPNTSITQPGSGTSWQMTPSGGSGNLLVLPGPTGFDTFKTPCLANTNITVSVYMYKDASYNGAAPQLVIKGGLIAGVGSAGSDVVTTAVLSSSGTWYKITAPTQTPTETGAIEWYVSVDGNAGNVYADAAAAA